MDKFSVPVALFQGLEDKVVPPNQAIEVYEQLSAKVRRHASHRPQRSI